MMLNAVAGEVEDDSDEKDSEDEESSGEDAADTSS